MTQTFIDWAQGASKGDEPDFATPYSDHVYDPMGNAIFQVVAAHRGLDEDEITAQIVFEHNAYAKLLQTCQRIASVMASGNYREDFYWAQLEARQVLHKIGKK